MCAVADEQTRVAVHPHIVFRSGPAGRRPALRDGPDVWEVVATVKEIDESLGEAAVERAAAWGSLAPPQAQAAMRYYRDFPEEIDAWIRANRDAADRESDAPSAGAPA